MSCAIFFAPSTIPPRQLHTFHGHPLAQRRHPESTVRQHVLARAPKQAGCKTLAHTRLSFARLPPRRGPPSPVMGASQASYGARVVPGQQQYGSTVRQHVLARAPIQAGCKTLAHTRLSCAWPPPAEARHHLSRAHDRLPAARAGPSTTVSLPTVCGNMLARAPNLAAINNLSHARLSFAQTSPAEAS